MLLKNVVRVFLCLGFACLFYITSTSAFAEDNCNVDAAYAQGMDDARNQASIQTQYGNKGLKDRHNLIMPTFQVSFFPSKSQNLTCWIRVFKFVFPCYSLRS